MRTLIVKLGLISVPAILMMAVNYWYDPAQLFHPSTSEQMGTLLARGYNVTGVTNYDERLVQKAYVEHLKRPNSLIVLGSSRSMQLRQEDFPGERFFNNGVSGGSIEDFIAIYGLYVRARLAPTTVVLAVDPFTFNANSGQIRWQSLFEDYDRMRALLGLPPPARAIGSESAWTWAKTSPLFSPDYFQTAWRSRSRAPLPAPVATQAESLPDAAITRADGWHIYPVEDMERPWQQVSQAAMGFAAAKPMDSLNSFDVLDPAIQQALERFIDFLGSRRVAVKLVLPPYHPLVFKTIEADPYYGRVLDAEQYLRRLAAVKRLELYGSFAAQIAGCGEGEFFDGQHPRASCMAHIVAARNARPSPLVSR